MELSYWGLSPNIPAWPTHENGERAQAVLLAHTVDSPADGEIVLVTHGDTMRVILGVLDGRSHRHLDWDLTIGNGAVMEREVDLAALRDGEYDTE